jgi:hypothetical protein
MSQEFSKQMLNTPNNVLESNARYRLRKIDENPRYDAERKASWRRDVKNRGNVATKKGTP